VTTPEVALLVGAFVFLIAAAIAIVDSTRW